MKKLLYLFSLLPMLVFAQTPRVALIPLDDEAKKLEHLVLAENTAAALKLNFLERTEIEKLTKELKLSVSGLADHNFSLNLQKLKNVELFAVLGKNNLIIFDATTGMRLIDCDLSNEFEQQSSDVILYIEQAIVKRNKIKDGKLLHLGFIPIVPINLTKNEEQIAGQLERLLMREMSSKPDMVVLERRHLRLLLEEPNSETKKLTKNLLTSSLLVRLSASKADNGKIRLSAYFSTPGDDRSCGTSELLLDIKKPLAPQIRNFLKFDTHTSSGNRSAESRNFAQQAQFAAEHLLFSNAVTSAVTATALNKQQELLLGEICATAAFRAWKYWGRAPKDKMDEVSRNFETAVRILVKHQKFNFKLMRFISKFGYVHSGTFNKLSSSQQQTMRISFELYFANYHKRNKYLLADMKTATTVKAQLTILNNRGKYLNGFASRLDQAWDYRYLGKYILPELEIYIRDMNKLIPQIKAFYAIQDEWKRQQKYELQRLELLKQSMLGNFTNRYLYTYRGVERKILSRTFMLLKNSKSLILAQRGAYGELMLAGKKPTQALLREYAKNTIKRFKTCFRLNNNDPNQWFNLERESKYFDLETKLKIWKEAIKQFSGYNIYGGYLIRTFDKFSFDEAEKFHSLIKKYRAQRKNDPKVRFPHGNDYVDMTFERMLKKLEKKFPRLNNQITKLPQSPFERILKPCPQYKGGKFTQIAYRNNKIFFAVLSRRNETFLVSIDTQNNFAIKEYTRLKNSKLVWYGHLLKGTLIKDYYAAQSGPNLLLYPLDGGVPKIIDFSRYYNNWPIGITGYGDKLFISYGQWPGDQRPGTLLEYDVKKNSTKILVSTLDRSVKWPLQGRTKLFHVKSFTVDEQRKCLLTLFPKKRDAGHNSKKQYLYGYFWESGKWQRLSKVLSLRVSPSDTTIYAEPDGIYFRWCGLWKLQADGSIKSLISRAGKGFTTIIQQSEDYPRYYIVNYKAGIAYCQNALFFLQEHKLYRFTQNFSPMVVIEQKYVISYWPKGIIIGILKPVNELFKVQKGK